MPLTESEAVDITDGGERITPDLRNWGYYAHLSLYSFAGQFVQGGRVLDAGCGTGYGCEHLRACGAASVLGVDISEKAVAFCKSRYLHPQIEFQVMDLCDPRLVLPGEFDVIFCNIGEHLPDVECFLQLSRTSLTPRGVLVLTVPAVVTPGILEGNLQNRFHVTLLPPLAWLHKLTRHFHAVQGFRHWMRPHLIDASNFPVGMALPPEQTTVRESDFLFIPLSGEELNREPFNISLVMMACVPRSTVFELGREEPRFPDDWNVAEMQKRAGMAG